MNAPLDISLTPLAPNQQDSALAKEAGLHLGRLLGAARKHFHLQSEGTGAGGESVSLPLPAVCLLAEILSQMAQGNAVTLIPVHAELTTQQAAELLNVSRPFLIKLLEQQKIPFRKVGKHRRIRCSDVLRFKQQTEDQQRAVLERLVGEGQSLDMGY